MIIRFSVENWRSFRDEATFSMVATKERQHGGRIPKVGKYQMRVLPIAAIYGGNASGKSNFFSALNFVKWLVVTGSQPDGRIPLERFRLAAEALSQPSRFSIELLIDETVYAFSFAVTDAEVVEEELVRITSSSETMLYHRKMGDIKFSPQMEKDEFLQFAFRGTRNNQLFLNNAVSQNVEHFKPIYDWFKDTLDLIAPDSRFAPFERFLDESNPLYDQMNAMLASLDTGISHLHAQEIPLSSLSLPEALKMRLEEDVKEGVAVRIEKLTERIVVTRQGGELVAKKLTAAHTDAKGNEVVFEMDRESDGTLRVIDLLPAFLELGNSRNKVYVIDELDRSLHSQLTRRLLEGFMAGCSSESRAQLLFTTHDLSLMDQELFRRDEMWVVERDRNGCSELIPFSDYKEIRYDKDIRKSYLQGRLGGIPRILPIGVLANDLGGECK